MSDLFFLAFIPLCFLVPVGFFLVLFIMSRRRKKASSNPGGKPDPAQTNPLLKSIADTLFEDIGLPSQDFRRELGVKYPELAMAFRQSVNFGLLRYTRQHWDCELDESLKPELLNRLLCDYYGFILPSSFTLEDLKTAIGTYFKQKKIVYKVQVETVENTPILSVTDKDQQRLFQLGTVPDTILGLLDELQSLARILNASGTEQAYLFRETGQEIGVIFVSADVYQAHLSSLAQRPTTQLAGL